LSIGKKIRSNILSPFQMLSIIKYRTLFLAHRLFPYAVDRMIERKQGVTVEHAGA
jgi:hypothetical protein